MVNEYVYLVHKDLSKEPYTLDEYAVFCSSDYDKAKEFVLTHFKKELQWWDVDDLITKIPLDKKCKIYLTGYTE